MLTEPRLDGPVSLTFILDVVYGHADGPSGPPLLLDVFAPPTSPVPAPGPPRPAVIWVHGGAWFSGTRRDPLEITHCALLAAHGFVAVSIEYRLSQDAHFPAQIHDVKAAIRWLRANAATYSVDPNRIGIWGQSAGGQLAALAGVTGDFAALEGSSGSPGTSSAVQAVAIASTPTFFLHPRQGRRTRVPDPTKWLFSGTAAQRADLMLLGSPLEQVRPDPPPPPFLIAHGTRDRTVAFEHAQRFHAALLAAGGEAELVPIEGVHHNWLPQENTPVPGRDGLWRFGPLALDFFRRRLGTEADAESDTPSAGRAPLQQISRRHLVDGEVVIRGHHACQGIAHDMPSRLHRPDPVRQHAPPVARIRGERRGQPREIVFSECGFRARLLTLL